jgi:lipopolysaccharide export system protein LptA
MLLIFVLFTTTPWSADRVEIVREQGESIVHLIGNVLIEDANTRITSDEARLYETHHYVVLERSVKIADKHGDITADFAVYHFQDRRGILRGSVTLAARDETIRADSLLYRGIEGNIEMYENIDIEDRKNNLRAFGKRGWYDLDDDKGSLSGKPEIHILRAEKDPVIMNAREFHLHTREHLFYGNDSVIAVIDSMTVYCDSIVYDMEVDTGTVANPYVVEQQNILKGESGRFRMKENDIEFFEVQKGWSKYFSESGSKNIVEGETIRIMFRDNKAQSITVHGNAKGTMTLKQEVEEDAGD